jgi:hypothetical protein
MTVSELSQVGNRWWSGVAVIMPCLRSVAFERAAAGRMRRVLRLGHFLLGSSCGTRGGSEASAAEGRRQRRPTAGGGVLQTVPDENQSRSYRGRNHSNLPD